MPKSNLGQIGNRARSGTRFNRSNEEGGKNGNRRWRCLHQKVRCEIFRMWITKRLAVTPRNRVTENLREKLELDSRCKDRRLLFVFFGLGNRMAHRTRMVAIEGLLGSLKQRSIHTRVIQKHLRPRHGLQHAEVSVHENKQRSSSSDFGDSME